MELETKENTYKNTNPNNTNNEKTKKIVLSEQQISTHKQMLEKIKNPIWKNLTIKI